LSFKLGWAVQVAGWAVQTFAVYLIPLALNFAWFHGPETMIWEIANYVFFLLAGLFFGILVAALLPGSTGSGRRVWIGPVGLLVFFAVWELSTGRFDILSVWFGMGEGGPIKAFVTWPALACCTYSAAMQRARRRRSHSSAGAIPGLSSSIEGQ
jgi:hypothetical protein